jgi:hypothetical protein
VPVNIFKTHIKIDFLLRGTGIKLALEVDGKKRHEDTKVQGAGRDAFLLGNNLKTLLFQLTPFHWFKNITSEVIFLIKGVDWEMFYCNGIGFCENSGLS